jgi:hypothetical protein
MELKAIVPSARAHLTYRSELMSKLLINEHPLMVLPKLAEKIGLNEAIFLQQLHYWLTPTPRGHKPHMKEWEGEIRPWIYNTYKAKTTEGGEEIGWESNFPFWSVSTIKRIVHSLREKELIIVTDKFNSAVTNRTLWYTIDYQAIDNLTLNSESTNLTPSKVPD